MSLLVIDREIIPKLNNFSAKSIELYREENFYFQTQFIGIVILLTNQKFCGLRWVHIYIRFVYLFSPFFFNQTSSNRMVQHCVNAACTDFGSYTSAKKRDVAEVVAR